MSSMLSSADFGSSPRVRGTGASLAGRVGQTRFIPACAGNGVPKPGSGGAAPVHPRVCGERLMAKLDYWGVVGSSPRVRGTARPLPSGSRRSRFIPACAGNGSSSEPRPSRPTVHPRVCGERRQLLLPPPVQLGSSPRVRGTVLLRPTGSRVHRFIPACAGNGGELHLPNAIMAVHPRVCGERAAARARFMRVPNFDGSSPRVRGTAPVLVVPVARLRFIPACAGNGISSRDDGHVVAGSSPRVRGTGRPAARPRTGCRFIPACAGNGRVVVVVIFRLPVHPRVCGERGLFRRGFRQCVGSSPRVRGTVLPVLGRVGQIRFIPACAGNGRRLSAGRIVHTVHPRVCGERAVSPYVGLAAAGSSPRVRGTGSPRIRPPAAQRFIPACAGNGGSAVPSGACRPVHPRVCGERSWSSPSGTNTTGSSPRVRGTARALCKLVTGLRFIPACAGNGRQWSVTLH